MYARKSLASYNLEIVEVEALESREYRIILTELKMMLESRDSKTSNFSLSLFLSLSISLYIYIQRVNLIWYKLITDVCIQYTCIYDMHNSCAHVCNYNRKDLHNVYIRCFFSRDFFSRIPEINVEYSKYVDIT